MSFSLLIDVQVRYSSSTDFLSNCLFSTGWLFWVKNSAKAGGKQANECEAQECGVFCIIVDNRSLHKGWISSPDPVICIARAKDKMKTRLSSSLSADVTDPGDFSLKYKASCGWNSTEPKPFIKRSAVDSKLLWFEIRFNTVKIKIWKAYHKFSCILLVWGMGAKLWRCDINCTR